MVTISFLLNIILGIQVFLCRFHREQAWDRWLKTISNKCSKRRTDILFYLRRIANSETTEDLDKALNELHESEFWSEPFQKFRNYFEGHWQSEQMLKV